MSEVLYFLFGLIIGCLSGTSILFYVLMKKNKELYEREISNSCEDER